MVIDDFGIDVSCLMRLVSPAACDSLQARVFNIRTPLCIVRHDVKGGVVFGCGAPPEALDGWRFNPQTFPLRAERCVQDTSRVVLSGVCALRNINGCEWDLKSPGIEFSRLLSAMVVYLMVLDFVFWG